MTSDNARGLIQTSIGTIGTFARTNPILTVGVLAATIAGIGATAVGIRRRKKSVSSKKRKKKNSGRRKRKITHRNGRHIRRATKRRTSTRRTKSITHSKPRHRGHTRVKFRDKKTGKMVSFLARKK